MHRYSTHFLRSTPGSLFPSARHLVDAASSVGPSSDVCSVGRPTPLPGAHWECLSHECVTSLTSRLVWVSLVHIHAVGWCSYTYMCLASSDRSCVTCEQGYISMGTTIQCHGFIVCPWMVWWIPCILLWMTSGQSAFLACLYSKIVSVSDSPLPCLYNNSYWATHSPSSIVASSCSLSSTPPSLL